MGNIAYFQRWLQAICPQTTTYRLLSEKAGATRLRHINWVSKLYRIFFKTSLIFTIRDVLKNISVTNQTKVQRVIISCN